MRTVDDLRPWTKRALEEAYSEGDRRVRCSRADFTAGFIAALEWLKSESSFIEAETPASQGARG